MAAPGPPTTRELLAGSEWLQKMQAAQQMRERQRQMHQAHKLAQADLAGGQLGGVGMHAFWSSQTASWSREPWHMDVRHVNPAAFFMYSFGPCMALKTGKGREACSGTSRVAARTVCQIFPPLMLQTAVPLPNPRNEEQVRKRAKPELNWIFEPSPSQRQATPALQRVDWALRLVARCTAVVAHLVLY